MVCFLRRTAGLLAAAGALTFLSPARADTAPAGPSATSPQVAAVPVSPSQARLEAMKVELAWLADQTTHTLPLKVEVKADCLEARGDVPSMEARRQALEVARQSSSLPVKDCLTIQPPEDKSPSGVLARAARAALLKSLGDVAKDFKITVVDGQLALRGEVATVEDKLLASRCLRGLDGCKAVQNSLVVPTMRQGGHTLTVVTRDGRHAVHGTVQLGSEEASSSKSEGGSGAAEKVTGASKASEALPSDPDDLEDLQPAPATRRPVRVASKVVEKTEDAHSEPTAAAAIPLPPAPTPTLPSGLPTRNYRVQVVYPGNGYAQPPAPVPTAPPAPAQAVGYGGPMSPRSAVASHGAVVGTGHPANCPCCNQALVVHQPRTLWDRLTGGTRSQRREVVSSSSSSMTSGGYQMTYAEPPLVPKATPPAVVAQAAPPAPPRVTAAAQAPSRTQSAWPPAYRLQESAEATPAQASEVQPPPPSRPLAKALMREQSVARAPKAAAAPRGPETTTSHYRQPPAATAAAQPAAAREAAPEAAHQASQQAPTQVAVVESPTHLLRLVQAHLGRYARDVRVDVQRDRTVLVRVYAHQATEQHVVNRLLHLPALSASNVKVQVLVAP